MNPLLRRAELALLAHARREIDASTALANVCTSLVGGDAGRDGRVRCAVVSGEDSALEIVGASFDHELKENEPAASYLVQMTKGSLMRRLLLSRAADGADAFANDASNTVEWIAIEPIRLRQEVHVGSLAAYGLSASDRDDTLAVLPIAGLLCAEIGFELLSRRRLWRQMHRFNNLLAVLSANVENIGLLVSDEEEEEARKSEKVAARKRFELTIATTQAAAHAIELRDLGRALSTAFFNPPRPGPKPL